MIQAQRILNHLSRRRKLDLVAASESKHSVFASAFLVAFEESRPFVDGKALFKTIERQVTLGTNQRNGHGN